MDIRRYFTSVSSKKDNKKLDTNCKDTKEIEAEQTKDIVLEDNEKAIMRKRKSKSKKTDQIKKKRDIKDQKICS